MTARLLRSHAVAHTRPIEGRVQAGCHKQSPEYGYDGVVTILARPRRRGQYRLTGFMLMPPTSSPWAVGVGACKALISLSQYMQGITRFRAVKVQLLVIVLVAHLPKLLGLGDTSCRRASALILSAMLSNSCRTAPTPGRLALTARKRVIPGVL